MRKELDFLQLEISRVVRKYGLDVGCRDSNGAFDVHEWLRNLLVTARIPQIVNDSAVRVVTLIGVGSARRSGFVELSDHGPQRVRLAGVGNEQAVCGWVRR